MATINLDALLALIIKYPVVYLRRNRQNWFAYVTSPDEPDNGGGDVGIYVPPTRITFTSTSANLAAHLEVDEGAIIEWTFPDESTLATASINKTGGCLGSVHLVVTPWSALRTINIGYGQNDGAQYVTTHLAAQQVSGVSGLSNATGLRQFLADGVHFTTVLNFSGNPQLQTIELFNAQLDAGIALGSLAQLQRLCVEDTGLEVLDIRGCTNLADLRAAVNPYTGGGILFADATYANLWHLCTRDSGWACPQSVLNNLPALQDMWLWNTNMVGPRTVVSNAIRSAPLFGNELTSLTIPAGATDIYDVDLSGNNLDTAAVDAIIARLVSLGHDGNQLLLTGNAGPSETGAANAVALRALGWTVTHEATVTSGGGGGGGGGGGTLTATYRGHQALAFASGNFPKTFPAFAIGTASATRRVIAAILVNDDGSMNNISSVTIGGVTATMLAHATNLDQHRADTYLYEAVVPTGTTADVVVSHPTNMLQMSVALYTVTGAASTVTPIAGSGGFPTAAAVNMPANSINLFAVAMADGATNTTTKVWTGATAVEDWTPGDYQHAAIGRYDATAAEATHALTFSGPGSYGQSWAGVSITAA